MKQELMDVRASLSGPDQG
jgi:hypothetical protein